MDNTTTRPARPAQPDALRTYGPPVAVALAFLWLFSGTIALMMQRWHDPTFSHGWIVLPAAIVIAYLRREDWLGTPVKSSPWGLVVIAFGLITMIGAMWADVYFMPYLSMLIVVGGMVLYLGGWAWMRKLIFPYAFLYFMVPWPDFLVEQVSFPMQLNTSVYAAALGNLIGIGVVRDGVSLSIPSVKASFEVAVACSGMRSLVALLCLAAAFAYFTPAALWKRWLLFALGLPMAMIANIIRVFLILCVANWISKDLAAKAFHDYSDFPIFLINTLGLMAIRNVMMAPPKTAAASAGAAETAGGTEAAPNRPVEDDDAF